MTESESLESLINDTRDYPGGDWLEVEGIMQRQFEEVPYAPWFRAVRVCAEFYECVECKEAWSVMCQSFDHARAYGSVYPRVEI